MPARQSHGPLYISQPPPRPMSLAASATHTVLPRDDAAAVLRTTASSKQRWAPTCASIRVYKKGKHSSVGGRAVRWWASVTLRGWRSRGRLVGIRDREAYLTVLNRRSNGEIERNPNFQSQMLMAFGSSMGSHQGTFASNSYKDPRRRGNITTAPPHIPKVPRSIASASMHVMNQLIN